MSQQQDKPDHCAHANSFVPSQPKAASKPSTLTLAAPNTTPGIKSQHVSAGDITGSFVTATSALKTGQLVKDEHFTLFEAVGALEIMDSKMDSGHLEPGEALDDEYDVLRALSVEEVIGIMDQILCHEAAWHRGHPLSQTLFTCLYIERLLWPEPKTIDQAQFSRGTKNISESPLLHQVLRPYCLATIKACYFVHSMITGESYYEEEDFTSQLYHRDLLPRATVADVQKLLDEGVSYIVTASISPVLKRAIETRLLFRRSFLEALEHDTGTLDARTKCSLACIPLLEEIKDTTHLGIAVSDCFSTKVQRSLASSVPPRPMVTTKLSDALSHLTGLCQDAADVDQILEVEATEDLFTAIWVFMSRIPQPSVYIRALVQSFLSDEKTGQILGKMSSKQFLSSSLAAVVLPSSFVLSSTNELAEAPTDPRFQIARILTEFNDKVCQPYLNVFRTACLNRCRTRRTMCHLALDWDSLQADTEDLDGALRTFTEEQPALFVSDQPTFSYPLSSWVYHHKLNHLRCIIQLGFELAIYAPDELAGVYWYLSYICGTHLSHIDRISFFLQKDTQAQDNLSKEPDPVAESDLKHRVAFQKTLKNLFRIYTQLKATEALSRALHALHSLLLRRRAFKIPPRPYSSNSLRYELRMKPFLSLNVPEPVNFETFQDESLFADVQDEQVLDEAASRVAEARNLWDDVLKAGWPAQLENTPELKKPSQKAMSEEQRRATDIKEEWRKGVKNVVRACIAASICVATMKKKLNASGELKGIQATIPAPGEKDCWHDWWIVPRVSESSS